MVNNIINISAITRLSRQSSAVNNFTGMNINGEDAANKLRSRIKLSIPLATLSLRQVVVAVS